MVLMLSHVTSMMTAMMEKQAEAFDRQAKRHEEALERVLTQQMSSFGAMQAAATESALQIRAAQKEGMQLMAASFVTQINDPVRRRHAQQIMQLQTAPTAAEPEDGGDGTAKYEWVQESLSECSQRDDSARRRRHTRRHGPPADRNLCEGAKVAQGGRAAGGALGGGVDTR